MKILLTLGLSLFLASAQNIPNTKQLIVVSTENWSTPNGTLQRYEKKNNSWHTVGKTIRIKLGRNGLGWGRGLHHIPKNAKIIKKEGDGKAPAGIFTLKQAFGYHPFVVKYPYAVYTGTDHCVDDVRSKYYNKIIDSTQIKKDYESFEHMKFPKDYYKYGIVVNHNHIDEQGAVKGAGSCIFMHIKKVPTAGCTVMNEDEMKEIIQWLDPNKNPLLVQGTKPIVVHLLKNLKM
jgi:D-alanyl-D-alanine dipeptidase